MVLGGLTLSGLAGGVECSKAPPSRVTVTQVTVFFVTVTEVVIYCLLTSPCLYSLAFWVGLEWFLSRYFYILWKGFSPLHSILLFAQHPGS